MNDFALLLVAAPMLLLPVALLFLTGNKAKRKVTNVYGFPLLGWKMLRNDQTLYEIERLFSNQGIVQCALEYDDYFITDCHSNIQKKGFEIYSGLVSLAWYDGDHVRDQVSLRYFTHFYETGGRPLAHYHSANMGLPGAQKLQELFGTNTWDIVIEDDVLAVTVPEIWEQALLEKFLGVCEELVT